MTYRINQKKRNNGQYNTHRENRNGNYREYFVKHYKYSRRCRKNKKNAERYNKGNGFDNFIKMLENAVSVVFSGSLCVVFCAFSL